MYNVTMRLYVTGNEHIKESELKGIVFELPTEQVGVVFESSKVFYHDPEDVTGFEAEARVVGFTPEIALAITSVKSVSFRVPDKAVEHLPSWKNNSTKFVECTIDFYDPDAAGCHSVSLDEEIFEKLNEGNSAPNLIYTFK